MVGLLSQNGSHFRARDKEAKRTFFFALPSSLVSAWFADHPVVLFSETVMHLVRGKRFWHSKKLKIRRNHSETAVPEFLNVKKPPLLSNSCTGYCKESVSWKKHWSVHTCPGGHSVMGRIKGKRNKSTGDLRKGKAELKNCPLR